jgi:hypothetical protein
MRAYWVVGALLGMILAIQAGTSRGDPGKETGTEKVVRLIKQLGDDEFDKREAASKELKAVGVPALEALQKAEESSDDIEIRQRAKQLIRAITAEWQGTWECVADHYDGKLTVRNPPYTSRWSFEGFDVIGQTSGDFVTVTQRGTLKIVESGEKYFKVNIEYTEGEGKGETLVGIADFREGQLRFSFRRASSGAGRPDEFVTKTGDKVMVYVFQKPK